MKRYMQDTYLLAWLLVDFLLLSFHSHILYNFLLFCHLKIWQLTIRLAILRLSSLWSFCLCFRNYVVQYILELKIPLAIRNLVSQFEGNYVHLSTQKFSSNVVEKCLRVFGEEIRSRIIHELIATSRFEQLLQDPYANYVIQSALVVSKVPSPNLDLHYQIVGIISFDVMTCSLLM